MIFRKLIFICLLLFTSTCLKGAADSTAAKTLNILIVPYRPMMHLSDADHEIAYYSGKNPAEIRKELRKGLINHLNRRLITEYRVNIPEQDFVQKAEDDIELLYHSMSYSQDTVYSLKGKAGKDSLQLKKKLFTNKEHTVKSIDSTYINVSFHDQMLLPDLAKRYDADVFIFLNELDIKTNFKDCLDLALKIYQREIKVHYTVFDRNGKQLYGDVAVAKFPSNSNDIDEIMNSNFPVLSDHILGTVNKLKQE